MVSWDGQDAVGARSKEDVYRCDGFTVDLFSR